MSEATLLDVYRSLTVVMSRSTRSAPDSLAAHAADLADSIRRTLEDPSYQDCLGRLLAMIRSGEVATQPNELREIASNLFAARLHELNELLRAVVRAEAQRFTITGADRLREGMRQLERQRSGLLDHWAVCDQSDAEAGRAEAALGECMTLEEVFAGLLRISPKELEKRAAEHRAANKP